MNSKKVALSSEFVVISHPIDDLILGRGATIVDAIDDFLKYCVRENCTGFVSPEIYNAHIKLCNESSDTVWGEDVFQPFLKKSSLIDLLGLPYEFRAREI